MANTVRDSMVAVMSAKVTRKHPLAITAGMSLAVFQL